MVEGAATWRDETLSGFDTPQLPTHLATWANFQTHFKSRWDDPYEANKSLMKIMSGTIQQTTSVKKYNDVFNEALGLTTEDDTNRMVLAAYKNGLKLAILNSAGLDQQANLAMTFAELQQLMVQIDKTLQQNNTQNQTTCTAPQQWTMSHNLVVNPQTLAANTVGSTPQTIPTSTYVRGTTPIKAEVTRQYTKLTNDEHEELCCVGGCFRCQELSHMAHQCPRRPHQIAAVETPVPTELTPVPVPAPATTESALPNQGF
jgi:hypothetical protein